MQLTPQSAPRTDAEAADQPRRRYRRWFVAVALLILAASVAATMALVPSGDSPNANTAVLTDQSSSADAATDEIAEAVKTSVVTVYTYSPTFSPGATGGAPTGAGSGWAYTDDGYIITNAHVVLGVESVDVMTSAGDLIPATVLGTDWYQDVAVLRLEPEGGQSPPPPATVGDSSLVRVGDTVIAIGTPSGRYANTVSVGGVAGIDRSVDTGSGYTIRNLIRHGAALAPGNSGGPLFSMRGEVVGMNVASRDTPDSGQQMVKEIGFAIEGNTVVSIADEIIANGFALYPFLGVQGQPVLEGQEVLEVEAGSPAADAGLRPGDVIVAIEDHVVGADGWFIDLLYRYGPDDRVTLLIDRDGESVPIEVVLGARSAGS